MHAVDIDEGVEGTTVSARFQPGAAGVAPQRVAPGPVRVEIDRSGAVPVARITGEIDRANAAEVEPLLAELAPGPAIVDLSGLAFLGSAGLQVLFSLANRCVRLAVVAPPRSAFRRAMEVAELGRVAHLSDSLGAALEHCVESMIVDCAHYRDGRRQHAGKMDTAEAAAICRDDPGFVWLGMVEPSPEELEGVQLEFGLHELAVEDAQSFHLRPKVETYEGGDHVRRAAHGALRRRARGGRVRRGVDLRRARVHHHRAPGRRPATCTARGCGSRSARSCSRRARRRCCGRSSTRSSTTTRRSSKGSSATSRRSSTRCSRARAAPTHRIYLLRREVTDFYRAVHPLLGPAAAITQGGVLEISAGLRQYFRDVDDHLKLVNEEIVAQRDLLTTILQANMAVVSAEQNEVVRKISAWAAIITVPTFVASFYGMNFEHMPELGWGAGYPLALALMVALALGLYVMFKRDRLAVAPADGSASRP